MKCSKLKMFLMSSLVALSAASSMASATVIDTLLPVGAATGYDMPSAGDPAVIAQFNLLTGNTYTTDDLFRFNKGSGFTNITQEGNLWIIDVGDAMPAFFMLKFGVGGTKTDLDTYFFQNVGDLSELVFSNEQVNFLTGGACASNGNGNGNGNGNPNASCNIGRLSHYIYVPGEDGTGGSGGNPVPEPATLMLLGAGMAGMMLRRRRR